MILVGPSKTVSKSAFDDVIAELREIDNEAKRAAAAEAVRVQNVIATASILQQAAISKLVSWGWQVVGFEDKNGTISMSRPSRKETGLVLPDGSYTKL